MTGANQSASERLKSFLHQTDSVLTISTRYNNEKITQFAKVVNCISSTTIGNNGIDSFFRDEILGIRRSIRYWPELRRWDLATTKVRLQNRILSFQTTDEHRRGIAYAPTWAA